MWVEAMGCSLLVSLASLICLIILPVICCKLIDFKWLFSFFSFFLSLKWKLKLKSWIFGIVTVKGKPSKTVVDSLAVFGVTFVTSQNNLYREIVYNVENSLFLFSPSWFIFRFICFDYTFKVKKMTLLGVLCPLMRNKSIHIRTWTLKFTLLSL